MKKNLLFLLSLFLFSCSDIVQDSSFNDNINTKKNIISAFKSSDKQLTNTRSAFLNSTKWVTGQTIKIKFLNGSSNLQNSVKEISKEWLKYANVKFEYITSGESDIRISFAWSDDWVNWSYIGNDAKKISQEENTMNLAWSDDDINTDDYKASVLQQFGLMLGLVYEHKNPKSNIEWNLTKVKQYFRGWSSTQINDFLAKYKEYETTYSSFDPQSIMVYALPSNLTTNGYGVDLNLELSTNDKSLIRDLYPGRYYNGYEHDLSEPDWNKLKTLSNNLIGVGRDIEGNYIFYPYSSGDIKKYTKSLTGETIIGTVESDSYYRNNPQIIPYQDQYLLLRPTYGAWILKKMKYINYNNTYSKEKIFTDSPLIGNQGAFIYDYDRSLLYTSKGVMDEKLNNLVAYPESTSQKTVIYWGDKYKWVSNFNTPYTDITFSVYEQKDKGDIFSEKNKVANINVKDFKISNGGFSSVYEYNNKLVVVNFGGSNPSSYGNIIILDPSGQIGPDLYKKLTHNDADWRSQPNSINFLCGSIYWKYKLMIYDQGANKYYFDLQKYLK